MDLNGFDLALDLPTPVISFPGSADSSPIPVQVTFQKSGVDVAVTGFDASDVTVNGPATLSGFSGTGSTYTFDLTQTGTNSAISLSIPAAAASGGGENSAAANVDLALTVKTRDLSGRNYHAEVPQQSGLLLYDGFAGYTNNTSTGKTTTDPSQVGFTTANTWGTGTGTIKG